MGPQPAADGITKLPQGLVSKARFMRTSGQWHSAGMEYALRGEFRILQCSK